MIQRLRLSLAPLLAGLAVLFAGLAPGVLKTGRMDPLDWLVPAGTALMALILFESRHGAAPAPMRLGWLWAALALPPALVCICAGSRVGWAGLALFGASLALAAALGGMAARHGRVARWLAAALIMLALLAVRPVTYWLTAPGVPTQLPSVGVLSALPLYGADVASQAGGSVLSGVGTRSPLWQALEPTLALRALDSLDARSLAGLDAVLLAQPRLLTPAERVALDTWVRGGGHAVILADPDLRWPGARSLVDPRRAPPRSLLGPLLRHWGVALAPAHGRAARPIARRLLSDGALLQLAGATRFALARGAPCTLGDVGLIARCQIGQGRALLVADADWINDDLWTLDPARPSDRSAWTSDAVPVLSHWLGGRGDIASAWRGWVTDENALISALRWALGLLAGLVLVAGLAGPVPILSHDQRLENQGQNRNIETFPPDSS